MPAATIETNNVDLILEVTQIAFALRTLTGRSEVPLRAPNHAVDERDMLLPREIVV